MSATGKMTYVRAIANANAANRLGIIIPCHRIIYNNGDIGGYGGGIHRKKWLLEHEKKNISPFTKPSLILSQFSNS